MSAKWQKNVTTNLFYRIFAIRDSSDHESNIRNPVVECSRSGFGYEHLVTTFSQLDLACGILYGKDSRNRSRWAQPFETVDLWKPKQGLSLTRMDSFGNHAVCVCATHHHLRSCFQPNNASLGLLSGFRLHRKCLWICENQKHMTGKRTWWQESSFGAMQNTKTRQATQKSSYRGNKQAHNNVSTDPSDLRGRLCDFTVCLCDRVAVYSVWLQALWGTANRGFEAWDGPPISLPRTLCYVNQGW